MSLLNGSAEEPKSAPSQSSTKLPLTAIGILIAAGLGGLLLMGSLVLNRLNELESQMLGVGERVEEIGESSKAALERAIEAEEAAVAAARGRAQAEGDATVSQGETRRAQEESQRARQDARVAIEEVERLKQERNDELNRLQNALSQIVETRRTALGLVMNLSSDYLKFDFDEANIRPENREILSRIVGILMTSKDYQVYVYGHTDNIGTEEYNMDLSERRAEAVRDYIVEAGIDAGIIDSEGFGKSQPLVPGTGDEARAKNRRVELGIVNTQIKFPGKSPQGN